MIVIRELLFVNDFIDFLLYTDESIMHIKYVHIYCQANTMTCLKERKEKNLKTIQLRFMSKFYLKKQYVARGRILLFIWYTLANLIKTKIMKF